MTHFGTLYHQINSNKILEKDALRLNELLGFFPKITEFRVNLIIKLTLILHWFGKHVVRSSSIQYELRAQLAQQ